VLAVPLWLEFRIVKDASDLWIDAIIAMLPTSAIGALDTGATVNKLGNRAITDLFGDLFSGNPVALCLCFGFILFVLAIAAAGV